MNPAIASDPKNSTPKIGPPGICETIAGKVMKDRPTPVRPSSSLDRDRPAGTRRSPRVAKTPMPARISNDEFAKATTSPGAVRLARRLRYEAYVIMMPKATDSEKKIWL